LWFSNLFAFFPPIYSYDEPLQYTFLFAALIALYAHRYVLFVLLFAVAAIARESQVILLPAIWFFVQPIAFDRPAKLFSAPSLMRALLLGLPVLIYVGSTLIYAQSIVLQLGNSQAAAERFAHFDLNFSHQPKAIETFLSIFLACGLPLYFLSGRSMEKRTISDRNHAFVQAFLLTFLLNTLIVLIFTKARETRLLVLPLFFLWPVFSTIFREQIKLI